LQQCHVLQGVLFTGLSLASSRAFTTGTRLLIHCLDMNPPLFIPLMAGQGHVGFFSAIPNPMIVPHSSNHPSLSTTVGAVQFATVCADTARSPVGTSGCHSLHCRSEVPVPPQIIFWAFSRQALSVLDQYQSLITLVDGVSCSGCSDQNHS
jgi:hypothetical protein